MKIRRVIRRLLSLMIGACLYTGTMAHGSSPNVGAIPLALAPQGRPAGEGQALEAPTDVKFGDFFKMPVGPKGLEPTGKLLELNGHRVRIVGYLAGMDEPVADLSYLTPYPIALGHEDEHLADDLPVSTVFVHSGREGRPIPQLGGLVRLTGRLSVGPTDEKDGRVSSIRLSLDRESLDSLASSSIARRKGPAQPAMPEHP